MRQRESANKIFTGLCSLRTPLGAPSCMPNQKTAGQAKVSGQAHRPFSQKDWSCLSVGCLCSALVLIASQELSLIVTVRGTRNCKLCWPPEQDDQECHVGGNYKKRGIELRNWGTRHMHQLPSRRSSYWSVAEEV